MRASIALAVLALVVAGGLAGTAQAQSPRNAAAVAPRTAAPTGALIQTGVTLQCVLTATKVAIADFAIGKLMKVLGGVAKFLHDAAYIHAFRIDKSLYDALSPLKDFQDVQKVCNVKFYFA